MKIAAISATLELDQNTKASRSEPNHKAWEGGVGCPISLVGTAVTSPFRASGRSKGHTLVHGLSSACPSPSIAYCAMEPALSGVHQRHQ